MERTLSRIKRTSLVLSILLLLGCLTTICNGYKNIANPDSNSFTEVVVAGDDPALKLDNPTNIAFSSDGRIFIAEKAGKIRVIDANGNLKADPWIDISSKVFNSGDKGLVGLALHPNFPHTPYIYVSFPVMPPPDTWIPDLTADTVTRGAVVRYTEVNGYGDINSEFFLLGKEAAKGIPSCHNSHVTGSIEFGLDGTLLISAGDGSHWDRVDTGVDTTPYDPGCAATFGQDEDIGALRAQSKNALSGKILRIDPETGNGIGLNTHPNLVPNPYFDSSAPDAATSKIFAYGMRNPWRLAVRPDTLIQGPGSIYFADPDMKKYEEVNVIRFAGDSYGWPCKAGPVAQPRYNDPNEPQSAAAFCEQNIKLPHHNPLVFWPHETAELTNASSPAYQTGFIGNCAGPVAVYTGTTYPVQYLGNSDSRAIFFSDYGAQWIKVLWVDSQDRYLNDTGIQDFASNLGPIVGLKVHPTTGELYYVVLDGTIKKFVYQKGNRDFPPQVVANAKPSNGNVNKNGSLTVQFTSDGTFDIENDPIGFLWDFGDGKTSTDTNPVHIYTQAGVFTATLKVTDSTGQSTTASVKVVTNNEAPSVKINTPDGTNPYLFPLGGMQTFTADVSDDQTPTANLQYRWEVRLIHNNHFHPDVYVVTQPTLTANLTMFTSSDERNSFEIHLVVTDDAGLSTTSWVRAVPSNLANSPPSCNISVTPSSGFAKLTVSAASGYSTDPDSDLLHYFWDWGDGTSGEGYATYHTFNAAGTYTITATVTDILNKSSSASKTITVTQEKLLPPIISPASGSQSKDVQVTITHNNGNSKIYYTIDGTTPTTSSTLYSGPFTIPYQAGVTKTVQAIAVVSSLGTSDASKAVYAFGFVPTSDLNGYWNFDDNSYTRDYSDGDAPTWEQDCSGKGNVASPVGLINTTTGKSGMATTFGGNSWLNTDEFSMGNTDSFSVALWVKIQVPVSTTDPTRTIFRLVPLQSEDSSDFAEVPFTLTLRSSTNKIVANFFTFDACQAPANSLSNLQWHHIAVVVSNGNCQVIVDGVGGGSVNIGTGLSLSNVVAQIGGGCANGFVGSIDEVYLYKRALADNEVAILASGSTIRENMPPVINLEYSLEYSGKKSGGEVQVGDAVIVRLRYTDDCLPSDGTPQISWTVAGPATLTPIIPYSGRPDIRYLRFTQTGNYTILVQASDSVGGTPVNDNITIEVKQQKAVAPIINPPSSFVASQSSIMVSIQSNDIMNASTIVYTTDGSEPNSTSSMYSSPIQISQTTTLKARALTAGVQPSSVVTEQYQFGDITTSLLVFHKFDQSSFSNNQFTDASGNNHNIAVTQAPQFMPGVFGESVYGNLKITNLFNAQSSTAFAASMWIRYTATSTSDAVVILTTKTSQDETTGWTLQYRPSMKIIEFSTQNEKKATGSSSNLFDGNWHNIAIVTGSGSYDGLDITIYVDNQDVTTAHSADPLVVTDQAGTTLTVGSASLLVDNLRFYSASITYLQLQFLARGYCGDGYCQQNTNVSTQLENCNTCASDCPASPCTAQTTDNLSFGLGSLQDWRVQNAELAPLPISVLPAGSQIFVPGLNFTTQPTQGNASLIVAWDGCGPTLFAIQKQLTINRQTCNLSFQYRIKYDTTLRASASQQSRTFEVSANSSSSTCNVQETVTTLPANQKADPSSFTTETVDLGVLLPSSGDANVTLTFKWNVPGCFDGAAIVEIEQVTLGPCSTTSRNGCNGSTTGRDQVQESHGVKSSSFDLMSSCLFALGMMALLNKIFNSL